MDSTHLVGEDQEMGGNRYDVPLRNQFEDFSEFIQYDDGETDASFHQDRSLDTFRNDRQVLHAHQQLADHTLGMPDMDHTVQGNDQGVGLGHSNVQDECAAPVQYTSTIDGPYRLPGGSLRWNVVDVDQPSSGAHDFAASSNNFQGQGTYDKGLSTITATSPDMSPDGMSFWPSSATADLGVASTYPAALPELDGAPMAPRQSQDAPWNYPMVVAGETPQQYRHGPSTMPYQAGSSTLSYNRPTPSPGNSWGQHRDDETNATSTLHQGTMWPNSEGTSHAAYSASQALQDSYGLSPGSPGHGLSLADLYPGRQLPGNGSRDRSRRLSRDRLSVPESSVGPDEAGSPTSSVMSVTPSHIQNPLPCRVESCRVTFSGVHRRGNLSRHIRIVHDGRAFVCGIDGCRKTYRRQDARRKHQFSRHPKYMTAATSLQP